MKCSLIYKLKIIFLLRFLFFSISSLDNFFLNRSSFSIHVRLKRSLHDFCVFFCLYDHIKPVFYFVKRFMNTENNACYQVALNYVNGTTENKRMSETREKVKQKNTHIQKMLNWPQITNFSKQNGHKFDSGKTQSFWVHKHKYRMNTQYKYSRTRLNNTRIPYRQIYIQTLKYYGYMHEKLNIFVY